MSPSVATRPEIDICLLHIPLWTFPSSTNSKKQASCQIIAKQNGRLIAKIKLAQGGLPRTNYPHNVKKHIMILKEGGAPTK